MLPCILVHHLACTVGTSRGSDPAKPPMKTIILYLYIYILYITEILDLVKNIAPVDLKKKNR